MLILTRRIGEKLIIGDAGDISVMVMSVKGHQVRLGVTAAKEVPVHREEVYHLIQQEKQQVLKKEIQEREEVRR